MTRMNESFSAVFAFAFVVIFVMASPVVASGCPTNGRICIIPRHHLAPSCQSLSFIPSTPHSMFAATKRITVSFLSSPSIKQPTGRIKQSIISPSRSTFATNSNGKQQCLGTSQSSFRLLAVREATFGMGCFWKPSEELLKVPGVIDTIVGYTGNPKQLTKPPTYENVCFSRTDNWVEGVRVVYDDSILSYDQLLNEFYLAQEPKLYSRQYASIIFVDKGSEQERIAKQWLLSNDSNNNLSRKDGIPKSITTIEHRTPFYKAEEYHQQYWQKTRPRIIGMIVLTAISSGILDKFTPMSIHTMLHTSTNAIVLMGLLYALFERKLNTKTSMLD